MKLPEGKVVLTNGSDIVWKNSADADYVDWFVYWVRKGWNVSSSNL